MRFNLVLLLVAGMFSAQSQTSFKLMFYNLLDYPEAPPQNRNVILKDILNVYQPDIFMVCELESEEASNDILNFSLGEINKNYEKALFVSNQSSYNNYSSLQQELYYNTAYFTLTNQEEITTNVRDINHYTLLLNTNTQNTNSNSVYLEVFVTHLKASQGTENEQKRLQMVEQFTNALNNLNPNSYVIFAGDFNFYTSSESGYQKILDPNNHVIMKDVLNQNNSLQSWHTNYNFKNIHTQATRISSSEFGGYGAGGGLDDRFDFITFSDNILNSSAINYVANSYKSFGNNGNCYNKRIDDTSCTGNYDFTLRSNLYQMSDHLPVVAQLESTTTLGVNTTGFLSDSFKFTNGNIARNSLNFTVKSNLIGEEILIFNQLGQEIQRLKITEEKNTINTSSLEKGVYYIKIKNVPESLKFVKI